MTKLDPHAQKNVKTQLWPLSKTILPDTVFGVRHGDVYFMHQGDWFSAHGAPASEIKTLIKAGNAPAISLKLATLVKTAIDPQLFGRGFDWANNRWLGPQIRKCLIDCKQQA